MLYDDADDDQEPTYRWEKSLQRSWDDVREDEHGRIVTVSADRDRAKKARLDRATQSIRKGLIRYFILALDCSSSAAEKDWRSTRLQLAKDAAVSFVSEFYDQNPISQLSVMATRKGTAEKVSDLSGSKRCHEDNIKALLGTEGMASLQNTILVSMEILRSVPDYGHKELLIIFSSLSTCDPGNILQTVQVAKRDKLRISVICLVAEVYICRHIAEETGGTISVAIDEKHLKELIMRHTDPPAETRGRETTQFTELVYMGFPKRLIDNTPILCFEGRNPKWSSTSFACPKCTTRTTDIPTRCFVCSLQLNSSSHIARSHHHLFPVANFAEETNTSDSSCCFSCLRVFDANSLRMQCPFCKNIFCVECDIFIHDSLHNCPGCGCAIQDTAS